MSQKEKILQWIDKNLFITISEAKAHGMSPMTLSRMVAQEELFTTERGVYTSAFEWLTDPLKKYLPACTLYPYAVISGISALTYYHLTDEEERKIGITIPIHRAIKNPRYRVVRSQGLWYSLGIQVYEWGCRTLRIYDIEKTVMDACKYQPEEVAYKALKGYLRRKDKDLSKLVSYAQLLGKPIEDKVRFFLSDE